MKYLIAICLIIMAQLSQAQAWTRMSSLPSTPFLDIEKENDVLYAATNTNIVYVSKNNGVTWTPSTVSTAGIRVTELEIFNHKIYAGTVQSGVFMSSDTGRTWAGAGAGMLWVNGFAQWRNHLYAATLGTGVLVLNEATNTWNDFNNSLPNYSVNVYKIVNNNDSLIISPGANGTFYNYNTTTNQWDEKYYFGILRPGILVSDLVSSNGSMLAMSMTLAPSPGIFRSDNDRANWHFDTIGLHRNLETDGNLGVGENNFYAVINQAISGGSWIYKHTKNVGVSEPWTLVGDFIPTGYTVSLKEFGSKVFLCRDDGIYTQDMITAIPGPVTTTTPEDATSVSIYPNPAAREAVHIKSNHIIGEVTIINLAGVRMFHTSSKQTEVVLPYLPNGLYIAQVTINRKTKSYKFIVE